MSAPKPTPHQQNWQVQDLHGNTFGDHKTEDAARTAAVTVRTDLQRPVRVRRTA